MDRQARLRRMGSQGYRNPFPCIWGPNYCSIAYVIRPDKPAGWDPEVDATTEYEKLMYQLPLARVAFEQDNEQLAGTASTRWGLTVILQYVASTNVRRLGWICGHKKYG